MTLKVKICGITTEADYNVCRAAGASWTGMVYYPGSSRHLTLNQLARLATCDSGADSPQRVLLTVDMTGDALAPLIAAAKPDMLQLHGRETPERVAEVKARYGLPVMKAVGIADGDDLPKLESYFGVADQILVDAKPPKGGELPGGNGLSFDWCLIAGRRWPCPWMLAGGLTPENVAEAVKMTGAKQVDVSSGVEDAPGQKNAELIQKFVQNSRA